MTRIRSRRFYEDGHDEETVHDHPGKELVLGDDGPELADVTTDLCPECGRSDDCRCDPGINPLLDRLFRPRGRWEIVYLHDHGTIADRRAVTVDVVWHDGDGTSRPPSRVTFTGPPSDMFPGLVVMCCGPSEAEQHFVADPGRFGEFGPDWVRRFYLG